MTEGARVILYGKLSFFTGRGTISLRATDIRAVGVGELLARIERLRALLAAEGLFDPRLKRPLPFLPGTIGLITARASAAEKDVLTVAQRRGLQCDSRYGTLRSRVHKRCRQSWTR